jgi:hypothetical protein
MSTLDTEEDAFGFGRTSSSAQDKIRQIKPSVPVASADMDKIDAVADNAGFVSRELQPPPLEYVYRGSRAQRPEPRIPLNMRVPVSLGGAFQRFCEENRYSYPEALAEVMKRAGLPTK